MAGTVGECRKPPSARRARKDRKTNLKQSLVAGDCDGKICPKATFAWARGSIEGNGYAVIRPSAPLLTQWHWELTKRVEIDRLGNELSNVNSLAGHRLFHRHRIAIRVASTHGGFV